MKAYAFSFFQLYFLTCCFAQNTIKWDYRAFNDERVLHQYVWSQTYFGNDSSKSVIDYKFIDNWEHLDNTAVSISSDGNYFCYAKYKCFPGFERSDYTLVIKSLSGIWQKEFIGAKPGFFSSDGKQYIFQTGSDLIFQRNGDEKYGHISTIASYKTQTKTDVKWIAYQLEDSNSTVVLENLESGLHQSFNSIKEYHFSKTGQWFICFQKGGKSELQIYDLVKNELKKFEGVKSYVINEPGNTILLNKKSTSQNQLIIQLISFSENATKQVQVDIDKPVQLSSCVLDESGRQVAFLTKNVEGEPISSLWYFKSGMNKAHLIETHSHDIDVLLNPKNLIGFTGNDHYIHIEFERLSKRGFSSKTEVNLDLWSYKDEQLQSLQAVQSKSMVGLDGGIIDAESGVMIYLERGNEKIIALKNDYALVRKQNLELSDRFWKKNYFSDTIYLLNLKTRIRQKVPINRELNGCWFSPEGKYLVYFDAAQGGHYFSHNLQTNAKEKISKGVRDWDLVYSDRLCKIDNLPAVERDGFTKTGGGVVGWIKDDEAILVYDNYDIWQLDLTGKKTATNLTGGYGRQHNLMLRYVGVNFSQSNHIFKPGDTLLLNVFNNINKENGFCQQILDDKSKLAELYIGPFFFQHMLPVESLSIDLDPIRALNKNVWIVMRQTSTQAPNYFSTTNFRDFKQLSFLEDHKNYNWLTAELVSFKQLDGTLGHGVLYKPENFDPRKKYPVIISWYKEMSTHLYQFPMPAYIMRSSIHDEPAWMVSHGYLVFIPDIYFTIGQWGPSVENTIAGAAKYLSRLSFVDSTRIGGAGHSNGGRFGYYLLSHSGFFSAFSVGSGTSNIISSAFGLNTSLTSKRFNDGEGRLSWAEYGTFGGGIGELWQNKETWIDHSAVLNANHVKSPTLMFHNRLDDAFAPGQSSEMFMALRRLNKPVWWLQYDDEEHSLNELKDLRDYTLRFTQFFDHYLKKAPAPMWMTQGLPYKLKQSESRYELDPSGTCDLPEKKECAVCHAWNEQFKRNPSMFEKPLSEWKLDKDIEIQMNKEETKRYKKNMMGEAQRIKENNDKLKGIWKGEKY